MDVDVPLALYRDIRLTNADKRIWMTMRLDRKDRSIPDVYSPTRLAERTGLARGTIYNSLARLSAAGWYEVVNGKPDAIINRTSKLLGWVTVSAELLASKHLSSRDIVMYSQLMDNDICRKLDGKFTYESLSKYVHACAKTVSRAIKALVNADWLNINKKKQMAGKTYKLDRPSAKYCRKQIRLLNMRLARPGGHGEAIALTMVTLVTKPADYITNAKPSTLVNPETGELMEIDIWIPEYNLVVEFNGRQHYGVTEFASAEDVAKQQRRDALKIDLLIAEKKNPVVLTAEDLSIAAVVEKLKGLAPLRDLRFYGPLVSYLNRVGQRYLQKTLRLEAQQA